MPLSPDTANQAGAWFRREAARYVAIAREHAERAELMATGTDKIEVNPRRRDQFYGMALEATRMAQEFLEFALAIRLLTLTEVQLDRGGLVNLPATFLRPCSAEDFPGQGLFRLPLGDVVRAPLASSPDEARGG
jgi:hypothetical protein